MDVDTWRERHRQLSDIASQRDGHLSDGAAYPWYSDGPIHEIYMLLKNRQSPSERARHVAFQTIRSAGLDTPIDHLCHDLYYAITSAAAELKSDRQSMERLVDFVFELTQLPLATVPAPTTPRERQLLKGVKVADDWDENTKQRRGRLIQPDQVIKFKGGILWQGLPGFGPMLECRRSCCHYGCKPYTLSSFEPFPWLDGSRAASRYLAFSAFVATLVARHSHHCDVAASYTWYGINTISDALEHHPKSGYRGWRCVPAACAWLQIAAKQVAGLIGTTEVCAPGPLWETRDPSGRMTTARWKLWEAELKKYAKDERLGNETDNMRKALEALGIVKVPD